MSRFEGGTVVFDTTWTAVKDQIDTRKLDFRYEEDSTAYQIYAVDESFLYTTIIYKSGQAPQDQAIYDTWRADFESAYKNKIVDFNNTQPVFISNVDGYSIVLKDGAAPTANDGYGVALIGYDGANYRMTRVDTSGRQILVGAGTAGTPSGGVISIQGVSGGQSMPVSGSVTVSGTVTATNPSVGTNDSAIPSSSTQIGGSDGTNLRVARIFDLDTGGGQQWVLGVGLRKASGGGSIELGTSTDPIRIDPTGTTTQPVSGTVTANQGGTWNITNISGTVSLPTGAATETSLAKLTLTQGSTTSGQSGTLIQGAVTTAAPTYTTGQTSPLSLDTTGALRITGSISASNPSVSATGATPPASATYIGGSVTTAAPTYTNGQMSALSLDTSGALRITGSISTSPNTDTVGSAGTLNALNAVATVSTSGHSSVGMFLAAGTLVGTIIPEISMDGGTTWVPTFFDDPSTGNKVSSIVFSVANTATTRTIIGAGGTSTARVRVSAFTSGTASCTLRATEVGDPSHLFTGANGSTVLPPIAGLVAGSDGTTLRNISTTTAGVVKTELQAATSKDFYSASFRALSPAATPTDMITITGSATKIARILRIIFSATQTTGASQELLIIKRSSLNAGGTSVPFISVPYSSTSPNGTILIRAYTANPAVLGTTLGNLRAIKFFIPAPATAQNNDYVFDFTNSGLSSGIVLNTDTEVLAINFNGAAKPTGLTVNCSVEWSEE